VIKKLLGFLVGVLLALALAATLLATLAWHALAPQPGEWATALHIGPFERQASVPTLLRWATHPLALPALDGRRIAGWRLRAEGAHRLVARCAPCRVQLAALGPQPLLIDEARLSVEVRGADRYDGTLRLGAGERPASIAWHAELEREGLAVQAELPPTPLARVLSAFAASLPELQRAQIEGSVALKLDATLGAAGWRVTKLKPTLADVSVAGLGTEALRDVDVAQRCRPQPAGGRIEGWIQNAVIAAEDQRFFEHPGARASRCRAPAPSPSSSPSCSTPATSATPRASCASGCMRRRWSARSARAASCSSTSRCCPGATASAAPKPRRATTSARAPASSSRAKPPGWPAC